MYIQISFTLSLNSDSKVNFKCKVQNSALPEFYSVTLVLNIDSPHHSKLYFLPIKKVCAMYSWNSSIM